jgi:hypothetical protein
VVQPTARARALTLQAAQRAARARIELAIVIPLIAIVLLANEYRREIFGLDMPVRAGLEPRTLAVSGAIVAVVFGLAAQQTLGNLIAGVVLISVRPFRVGDRVRLQSGGLAGEIEGVVSTLGLLYTTFARGEDSIIVPNNIVLASAVVPLRGRRRSTCVRACAPT